MWFPTRCDLALLFQGRVRGDDIDISEIVIGSGLPDFPTALVEPLFEGINLASDPVWAVVCLVFVSKLLLCCRYGGSLRAFSGCGVYR